MKTRLLSLLLAFLLLPGPAAAAEEGADPYLPRQTSLAQIDYFPVWERGFDGAGVTIALIDSGVFAQHEDLQSGNVLPTVDMLRPGDPAGDSNGHGTFIAGMLAAERGNGAGIAGMADGARILPFRCFTGRDETDLDYVVRAVYSAVDDYGCDVINLSVGMTRDTGLLRAAVDHAAEQGVIIVSAVGNDGGDALNYPAAYDNVVGVGSVDTQNNVSAFSQRNGSVFVTAPGEALVSTGISGQRAYVEWEGTSFACVHVTALAAVAKQYDKSIDTPRFMELLRQSAVDLGPAGYDEGYGWGLISASAFLDALAASMAAAPEFLNTPAPEPERGPGPALPGEGGRFADIAGHWARSEILAAAERGLFGGVTETEFRPDAALSRGMAAAVLYRLAGSPTPPAGPAFEYADVLTDAWYAPAVAWASAAGVFTGDGFGLFRPNDALTRQEFAAVIRRFARWQGRDAAPSAPPGYADAESIAPWARESVAWCRERGLMTGFTETEFYPGYGVTRAMAAAILVRYTDTMI